MSEEQRQAAMALMAAHPVAVLATTDAECTPAAAVVLYAETADFGIIFGTHSSRKLTNLTANPKAAFVITRNMESLQLHGRAVPAPDQASAAATFMAKHPELNKHLAEGSTFFVFTPTWMRYLNYGQQPPVAAETDL